MDAKQIDFFDTFGFIKFPGLLKADIEWIQEEFENVFPMFPNLKHNGSKRTMIVPFIDQREKLSALLDHPAIDDILTSLLGSDYNYMGSDGNFYSGDTPWHPDGQERRRKHIKIAFYLDPLTAATGALRVIPGSHQFDDKFYQDLMGKIWHSADHWGIGGSEVPAVPLDVVPGDVLVFKHETFHSSWGGNGYRRMFTINACQRFGGEQPLEDLEEQCLAHYHYARDHYYGPAMRGGARPGRQKHLEQVMSLGTDWAERTKHLPSL
ncbi:phytanoyl-CoA dioxygenase family protein [Cohnella sp. GCM10027633]|uniref:phytanoyl-CoA dioxygenase family protein n=1 Tax=unclassified Cohnella TaxID=2636738 RepID=UPI0036349170